MKDDGFTYVAQAALGAMLLFRSEAREWKDSRNEETVAGDISTTLPTRVRACHKEGPSFA